MRRCEFWGFVLAGKRTVFSLCKVLVGEGYGDDMKKGSLLDARI